MEKSAWTRYETRAEELLSAMSNQEVKPDMSDEEAKPEKKRSYKIPLQNILVTCCGILAIAAVGKGFLYLDNGISTVGSTVGISCQRSQHPQGTGDCSRHKRATCLRYCRDEGSQDNQHTASGRSGADQGSI